MSAKNGNAFPKGNGGFTNTRDVRAVPECPNLHWMFYHAYFDTLLTDRSVKAELMNQKVVKFDFSGGYSAYIEKYQALFSDSLCLKSTYPGLLTGLGNPFGVSLKGKDIPDLTGSIQMGFSLDYVTGLPYIPGSSIKGILRSAFYFGEYGAYVAMVLKEFYPDLPDQFPVKKLESAMFGEADEEGDDVFFDAFPQVENSKNMLELDNITPHKSITENPIPLTMLRVRSEVPFVFGFRLKDTTVDGVTITREVKAKLFERIFTELGVGAKTNVGYGRMQRVPDSSKK